MCRALGARPLTHQNIPVTYALRDSEILRLLAALPNSTMGRRYGFAFQLMATYGLKAEDLRYLQVCEQESDLWLRSGRHRTELSGRPNEPCKLEALAVVNVDGAPQDWNLVTRVARGERLPPLGTDSEASQYLETYLNDQPAWREIQNNALLSAQQATTDSFYQRYASTAQDRGGEYQESRDDDR